MNQAHMLPDRPRRELVATIPAIFLASPASIAEVAAAREISPGLSTEAGMYARHLAAEANAAYGEYVAAHYRENDARAEPGDPEPEPGDLGLGAGQWHDPALACNYGLLEPAEGTAEAEAFRRMDEYARQEATRAVPGTRTGMGSQPRAPGRQRTPARSMTAGGRRRNS
jgi:hypothetical protein